jgi:hypothetical protein
MLNCRRHKCPQRCHQPHDHSKIQCQSFVELKCSENHVQKRKCHKLQQLVCRQCERTEERKRKLELELEMQNKQDKPQVQNAADTDKQDRPQLQIVEDVNKQDIPQVQDAADMGKQGRPQLRIVEDTDKQDTPRVQIIEDTDKQDKTRAQNAAAMEDLERQLQIAREQVPDSIAAMQRAYALEQKKRVLRATEKRGQSAQWQSNSTSWDTNGTLALQRNTNESQIEISHLNPPEVKSSKECELETIGISPSEAEWERQKQMDNASNDAIDRLMALTGLEELKAKVLSIKAKAETVGADLTKERLGMAILGNSGTGRILPCSNLLAVPN